MRQINKKILWIFLIFSDFLMAVGVDKNISSNYDAITAVGGIFEPILSAQTTGITAIIAVFSLLFGGYITFVAITFAIKMNKVKDDIDINKDRIYHIEADITKTVHQISNKTQEDIDKLEKWLFAEMKDIHRYREKAVNKLEHEIELKVKNEIISSSQEMLKDVKLHAYKELIYQMGEIKSDVEKQLFSYQKLIYEINMIKGLEYDEVLREDMDANNKLKSMVNIQKKYNKTNNINIPNLLSNNIKKDVIPALKILSEENDELREVIKEYIVRMLDLDIYTPLDTYTIENTLKKSYNYDYAETHRVGLKEDG